LPPRARPGVLRKIRTHAGPRWRANAT
jgi:hypothetical protein